jgi:hypothetical protein
MVIGFLFQKGAVHTDFDIYAFITTNFDLRYIYTLLTNYCLANSITAIQDKNNFNNIWNLDRNREEWTKKRQQLSIATGIVRKFG